MKRRKVRRGSDREREIARRCAFCNRAVPEDHEVFGFGARARPGADLEQHRGRIIEILVATLDRKIPMVVVGADSAAAREGCDCYFHDVQQIVAA